MNTQSLPLQTIEWLGLHFEAPAEWEIVRHGTRPEEGRLSMTDRRRQRLELAWAHSPTGPDIDRLIHDYRAQDLEHDPECRFETLRTAGWRGYRRRKGREELITRVVRYDRTGRRWIELVLTWPDGIDERIERQVLGGFEATVPAAGARRWRAFGLGIEAPESWRLVKVRAVPGDLTVRYEGEKKRTEAAVRRVKSAHDWFDGDVARYVRRGFKGPIDPPAATRYRGHEAATADAVETGRFFRRSRRRRDLAWHCPETASVLRIVTRVPRRQEADPAAFRVRCCPAAEGAGP